VWWDNPATIATVILAGRERKFHDRYLALASHDCFEPWACMPRRGNEKAHVENRVYDLQRRWATPVPRFADLAALNDDLRGRCLSERERCVTGQEQTIGERWAAERAVADPLPPRPFEACIYAEALVDKRLLVRFDNNSYSVPREVAFTPVTVKATLDEVVILRRSAEVARHPRCYQRGQLCLNPLHYLPTLDRRAAALDRSPAFERWHLPAVFERLREGLEQRHGATAGRRHYARVLQLLLDHPQTLVQQVIEEHLARERPLDAATLRLDVERRSQREPRSALDLPQVQVPLPDLSQFDRLLNGGHRDA
jgi:hypothetical protein